MASKRGSAPRTSGVAPPKSKAPSRESEPRRDVAGLELLQRSAGNRAVARTMQRAPEDGPPPVEDSPRARAATIDERVAGSETIGADPGAVGRAPTIGAPPTGASAGGGAQGTTPASERLTPDEEALTQLVSFPPSKDKPVTASHDEAAAAFEAHPTHVLRSLNPKWHQQAWRISGGKGDAPPIFRTGDHFAVHPDNDAPAYSTVRNRAVPVSDAEVAAEFAKNPKRVLRSPHPNWHAQFFVLDKGTGEVPMAYRVGDTIAIHPDHPGQATPVRKPEPPPPPPPPPAPPRPAPPTALGPPVDPQAATFADAHSNTVPAINAQSPTAVDAHAPTVAGAPPAAAVAGAGGTGGGGGTAGGTMGSVAPAGYNPAGTPRYRVGPMAGVQQPPVSTATYEEAEAAYLQNPKSVMRSPHPNYHAQMYEMSWGQGEVPTAFRVGDHILVAPDHPAAATPVSHEKTPFIRPPAAPTTTPPPAAPAPATPAPAPATHVEAPPATPAPAAPATTTASPATTAPPTTAAAPTTTTSAPPTVTAATAAPTTTSSDPATHPAAKTISPVAPSTSPAGPAEVDAGPDTKGEAVFEQGTIAGAKATRTSTQEVAGVGKTSKATSGSAAVTSDLKLKTGVSHETETTVIKDGKEVTTKTGASGGLKIDDKSIGGEGALSSTSPTGTKKSITAGTSRDKEGNTSTQAGAGITTKRGAGATLGAGTAHNVTAGEVEELADGTYQVTYVIDDSVSGSAGVSVSGSGAVPVGVGAGASRSSSKLKTGTVTFTSEAEAREFSKHPGKHVVVPTMPPNTVAGALQIPIGQSRGVGKSTTNAVNASATVGATVTKSGSTTHGEEISIRRTGDTTVRVTTSVSGTEASAWGISGLGLENEKGGSSSTLFELTYDFDLAKTPDASEFTGLCGKNHAPSRKPILIHKRDSRESHDKVSIAGTSTNVWSGGTWRDVKQTEDTTIAEQGGYQAHDATHGTVGGWLGEKETHSRAQIVRSTTNGRETQARAELTVSGESGEKNREEFGKIFGDSRNEDARASGKWKLSAPVDMRELRSLEKNHKGLREAPTLDAKMKIYAELVEREGASMLGGQVGMSSSKWDLELKGDENFPGEAGRQRIKQLTRDLRATLKNKPDAAEQVVQQASAELAKLAKRRVAVSAVTNPKQYTDLPGPLREQQVRLIDQHINDLNTVKQSAQALTLGTVQPGADTATTQIQRRIVENEAKIVTLKKQITDDSRGLFRVIRPNGGMTHQIGTPSADVQMAITIAVANIKQAIAAIERSVGYDDRIAELRNAAHDAAPKDQPAALAALDTALADKVKAQGFCLAYIEAAANAVVNVADKKAMLKDKEFWVRIGADWDVDDPNYWNTD
jgi:hypothetical protein